MPDIHFQCSTRRTGLLRRIKVTIFEKHDDFLAAYHRTGKAAGLLTEVPENYRVEAACLPRSDWDDRDPRPYQVRMIFSADHLTASTVTHEATHAALHIYSIDSYRDHSRASAHMNIFNETVPYLVGDIFAAVAQKVMDRGLELHVGRSDGNPL